jgi:hypothetical protein
MLKKKRRKKKKRKNKKKEKEKADIDLQKHYKNPHSSAEKKGIIVKYRKEADIYNYGLI